MGGGGAENRPTLILGSCQQKKELDTSKFVVFSFKAQTHVLKSYRDISRVVFEIQVLKIKLFFKILQKVKKIHIFITNSRIRRVWG